MRIRRSHTRDFTNNIEQGTQNCEFRAASPITIHHSLTGVRYSPANTSIFRNLKFVLKRKRLTMEATTRFSFL